MFLIAYFFDVQYPSDDGSCGKLTSAGEAACLQPRSIFNHKKPECDWVPEHTGSGLVGQTGQTGPSGQAGHCSWIQPDIDPQLRGVVITIVTLLSVPADILIRAIFVSVLMAPTLSENKASVDRQDASKESATATATTGAIRPPQETTTPASTDLSRPNVVVADSGENGPMRTGAAAVQVAKFNKFAKIDKLTCKIPEGYSRLFHKIVTRQPSKGVEASKRRMEKLFLQQGSQGTLGTLGSMPAALTGDDRDRVGFESEDAVTSSRKVGRCLFPEDLNFATLMDELQWNRARLAADSREGSLPAFDAFWGELLSDSSSATCLPARSRTDPVDAELGQQAPALGLAALVENELEQVAAEAASCLDAMERKSMVDDAHMGTELFNLFLLDLVGGKSTLEAKVLGRQLERLMEQTVLVSFAMKSVAFALVMGANVFFVFAAMLYGSMKGLAWQREWLACCVANICVDVFFKQTSISLIGSFIIPSAISGMPLDAVEALFSPPEIDQIHSAVPTALPAHLFFFLIFLSFYFFR